MDLVMWAADQSRRKLALLESRWSHSRGVASRAEEIALAVDPDDQPLLVAAAYLHDVGYAPELARCGFHPIDGARWLRLIGLERLAGLVAYHTGARFEAKVQGMGHLLAAFSDERSAVTDALAYSDLTTGPNGERVTVRERLDEIEHRYGPGSLVVASLNQAADYLGAMVERTEGRLSAAGLGAIS
jgi:hypothetical protein